jgi:hypothetical protein
VGEDDGDGDVKQDFCVLVKIVHVTRGAFKNGDAYYDGTVANVAKILKIQPIRIGRVLIFYDVIYHTRGKCADEMSARVMSCQAND